MSRRARMPISGFGSIFESLRISDANHGGDVDVVDAIHLAMLAFVRRGLTRLRGFVGVLEGVAGSVLERENMLG